MLMPFLAQLKFKVYQYRIQTTIEIVPATTQNRLNILPLHGFRFSWLTAAWTSCWPVSIPTKPERMSPSITAFANGSTCLVMFIHMFSTGWSGGLKYGALGCGRTFVHSVKLLMLKTPSRLKRTYSQA